MLGIKGSLNKLFRGFGFEIHGIGYLEKISKTSFKNDPFFIQKELFKEKKVQCIVDAGANVGNVAAKYSEMFPEAKILCFEPTPSFNQQLEDRFRSSDNVCVSPNALGDRIGNATLFLNRSGDTNSLLESTKVGATSDKQCETHGSMEVEIVTLDSVALEKQIAKIDILKMDVQGSELSILNGSKELLRSQAISMVYTEAYFKPQYLGQPLVWDIAALLRMYDYSLVDLFDLYYNEHQVLWGDALFAHRSLIE